ncbi:MAG: hypothetical protein IJS56_00390 [Bacilli bacterium]|nr:hypothetical protein [Bacilli bacterium]
MKELSILEIISTAFNAAKDSKVLVLIGLEILILLIHLGFSKLIDKKLNNRVCLASSLLLLGFYLVNYINTILVFVNNVSAKVIELIYFPTTLEFIVVMILSIIISLYTLLKSKKTGLKIINVLVPSIISFLFFCIIENVNSLGIDFNEFSVFTDSTLMSFHELAMGLFISWLVGLVLYRIDTYLINKAVSEVYDIDYKYSTVNSLTIDEVNNEVEEDLDMPKLKTN